MNNNLKILVAKLVMIGYFVKIVARKKVASQY